MSAKIQRSVNVLRGHYRKLADEIAQDILDHTEDFDSSAFGQADTLLERHSRRLCDLGACLEIAWGPAERDFGVYQGGECPSIPAAGCKGRANDGRRQKTRRPRGFRGKARLTSLLLSRRSTKGYSPSSLLAIQPFPQKQDAHGIFSQAPGHVFEHLNRFVSRKKPAGTEALGKDEFRCFGCGGVIRQNEEACKSCGWTWI